MATNTFPIIPQFAGTEEIEDYLIKLECYKNFKKLNDEDIIIEAVLGLSGDAFQFYKLKIHNNEVKTFSDFKVKFQSHFSKPITRYEARIILLSLKQNKKESVGKFAFRIEKAAHVLKSVDETATKNNTDAMMLDTFFFGLESGNLRQKVYERQIKKFKDALEYVKYLEAKSQSEFPSTDGWLSKIQANIAEINQSLDSFLSTSNNHEESSPDESLENNQDNQNGGEANKLTDNKSIGEQKTDLEENNLNLSSCSGNFQNYCSDSDINEYQSDEEGSNKFCSEDQETYLYSPSKNSDKENKTTEVNDAKALVSQNKSDSNIIKTKRKGRIYYAKACMVCGYNNHLTKECYHRPPKSQYGTYEGFFWGRPVQCRSWCT